MSLSRPSEHDCPKCQSPLTCWPEYEISYGGPRPGTFIGIQVACTRWACGWKAPRLVPHHLIDAGVAQFRWVERNSNDPAREKFIAAGGTND